MADSHMVLLLQLIHSGGEVDSLLRRGLQFSQIAQMMSEAESEGLVKEENENLVLTDAGLAKMRTNLENQAQREDGGWISPLDEFRINKISTDDIYLPSWYTALIELGQDH
jgi:hypothetical protein